MKEDFYVDLAQDKLDLIEKVIKNDRKFSSNEDLYDDFFNETCKHSLGIINIVSSNTTLESYLRKIATTAIINVLKDSGRLRRSKTGYVEAKELPLEEKEPSSNTYTSATVSYENFVTEISPEDLSIQKDTLRQVAKTVTELDAEDSSKQYLQIYKLRYDNGMTQKEISEELGLSQGEISKRLFKLMEEVKKSFR